MERVWLSRLRWRLRGAWQGPAFAALTVGDAILLHELPIAGDGPDWYLAVLGAVFFNLLAVAVAGPLLGLLVRRRRADLPPVVARDRGGTVALLGVAVLLAGLGVAHRPALRAEHDALAEQAAAVRRYVARHGQPQYRRHLARADAIRFGDDLYRTCVPGDDPDHALCLFVRTDESPPGIEVDPNPAPNATYGRWAQP